MTRAEAHKEVSAAALSWANGCDRERIKRIRTALRVLNPKKARKRS